VLKYNDLIDEIVSFWFSDEVRPRWFKSTIQFDRLLRDKYQQVWDIAKEGEFDCWEQTPEGALALVIVLDQFPLNMFRKDARQYSTEAHARTVAGRAIEMGHDQMLTHEQKGFMYLPYMHSECMQDQDRAVELYIRNGLEKNLPYAHHHREVVQRFGRFPHRNEVLGRESTPQEIEYLKKANW
jgi:uncharacterized protein (DUF924 family)